MIERGDGPIDEILWRFGRELHEAGVDAVQVLGIYQEGNNVYPFSKGFGNNYARIGLCREYLIRDKVQIELSEAKMSFEDEESY